LALDLALASQVRMITTLLPDTRFLH
jgi:hypothetical protein